MNNYLLLLIFLLTIISCTQKKQDSENTQSTIFYPEVKQRTLIVGQIDNFHAFKDAPKNIELTVNDIAINNRHEYNLEIDDSGKFVFDIPLYHSTISHIYYGDSFIEPYLFPNDTIFLNFDLYKDGIKLKHRYVRYDNKHNKFQKNFHRYHQWVFYRNRNFRKKLPSNTEPQKVKEEYLSFEKEIFEKIKNIPSKDSLTEDLTNYLIYRSKYSIYNELFRIGSKIEKEVERQEFFSFLNDSVVFNKDAMLCADYQYFLNNYQRIIETPLKAIQDSLCKNEESNSLEIITNQLNQHFTLRKGIWAEFMAASYLNNYILKKELDQSLNSSFPKLINKYFEDIYIKQLLLSSWKKSSNKDHIIKETSIPKGAKLKMHNSLSGEDLWDKIIRGNKGKAIYIDIWATWCSPCKRQIPHSQRMYEMLHGEKVSFIYLCCKSEEETWKNVIKLYQINGTHILLTKEQYDYLKEKFSVKGVPHYILIDKNGKVDFNGYPGCNTVEVIETKLRNLIAKK